MMPKDSSIKQNDVGFWEVYIADKMVARCETERSAKNYLKGLEYNDIAGRSLNEWRVFARQDDCLERMVPSDLRELIAALIRKT